MAGASTNVTAHDVVFVNSPSKPWAFPSIAELWSFREFATPTERELKVRYQTEGARIGPGYAATAPDDDILHRVLQPPRPSSNMPCTIFGIHPSGVRAEDILSHHGRRAKRWTAGTPVNHHPRLLSASDHLALITYCWAHRPCPSGGRARNNHGLLLRSCASVLAAPLFLAFAVLTAFSDGLCR
jgi:hypothetical protein